MKYSETLTADCSKEGFMDLEESSSFLLKEIQRVQPENLVEVSGIEPPTSTLRT